MECTQAIDFTQPLFDTSQNEANAALVVGWIEMLGSKHKLKQGCTKLGRDPEQCEIVLENRKTISKEHAMFEVEGFDVTVCDLGSRNKSKLNRMFLKPEVRYALQGDENLTFGDVSAKFIKNENAEISDRDSDISLLTKNIDINISNDMFVPETPVCGVKPNREPVYESPIPESQDCFNDENKCKSTEDKNISNEGIGVVCSLSKMPKISDEYNSDESTDIEDFLESYKVSCSPIRELKPSDQNNENSDEKDVHLLSGVADDTSESVDLFQQPTQVFVSMPPNKVNDGGNTDIDNDIYSAPTQPACDFVPEQSDEKKKGFSTVNDSCDFRLSTDSCSEFKQLSRHLESDNEAEKVNQMEASQSLLNEVSQFEVPTLLNISTEKYINVSSEEVFKLIKLENVSPSKSQEFKFPSPVKFHFTSPKKSHSTSPIKSNFIVGYKQTTDNSAHDIFDAPTQIPDTISNVEKRSSELDDSQLTQLDCEPVSGEMTEHKENYTDSTQDVLNVFNVVSHKSVINDAHTSDGNDCTQSVLNAFKDDIKSSGGLNAEKCTLKVRSDLVSNLDLPTQPEPVNSSTVNKNTSMDDESISTLPTQVVQSGVAILERKLTPTEPSSIETNDVFNMATQCVVSENTNDGDFNTPAHAVHSKNYTDSASVIQEDKLNVPNKLILSNENVDLNPTSEIDQDVSDIPTQVFHSMENIDINTLTESKSQSERFIEDVFDIPTQVIHTKEMIDILSDEDISDSPTQVIHSKENNDVLAEEDISNIPTQVIHSTENNYVLSKEGVSDIPTQVIQAKEGIDINILSEEKETESQTQIISLGRNTDLNLTTESLHDNEFYAETQVYRSGGNTELIPEDKICKVSDAPLQHINKNISDQPTGIEDLEAACLPGSSLENSCVPQNELDVEDDSNSNITASIDLVKSPENKTGLSGDSSCEKYINKSFSKKTHLLKSDSASEIVKRKKAEDGFLKDENFNTQSACENEEDFSGVDSSPAKVGLKKTNKKSKSKKINSASSSISKSDLSNTKHLSAAEIKVKNSNKNNCLVVVKKIITPKKDSNLHICRKSTDKSPLHLGLNKRGPVEVSQEATNTSTLNEQIVSPRKSKRTSRSCKPPSRYSPEPFIETVEKVENKVRITNRATRKLTKAEPEVPSSDKVDVVKRILPSRNIGKRLSNRIAIQESITTNKRFKSDSTTDGESTQTGPTRRSTRKSAQKLSVRIKAEDYVTESMKKEVDEVKIKPEDVALLTNNNQTNDDQNESISSNRKSMGDKEKIKIVHNKKTRSQLKYCDQLEESSTSQVEITKIELAVQQPRRRGRPKKVKNPGEPFQLHTIKESIIDISVSKIKVKDVKTQEDSALINEITPKKSTQKSNIERNNSRLKRKRSSSSLSTEVSPSVCRKSSRSGSGRISTNSEHANHSVVMPDILFTGYKDENDEQIVTNLGGQLVESARNCSVLVTTGIKRTCKLMAALGGGSRIVSPEWLAASKKAGHFLDTLPYLVSDRQSEKKFGFNLELSMSKACSDPLFIGYSIHATKSVEPTPEELKEIVECAKGRYLKSAPKSFSDKLIIVSCPEDKKSWTSFKKLKLPVVGVEFILTGVLRQEILISQNLLC